jgi:hypothetical protein
MTIPRSVERLKRALEIPSRNRPGNPPANPDTPADEPVIIEPITPGQGGC